MAKISTLEALRLSSAANKNYVDNKYEELNNNIIKDYNDLTNKPEIPSIEGLVDEEYVQQQIADKVDIELHEESIQRIEDMFGGKSLRYITQEEYNNLVEEEKNRMDVVWNIIDADDCFSGDYNDLINKPELATVATSGSYNDLTDKPVIPSIDGLASESYVQQEIAKIQVGEDTVSDEEKEYIDDMFYSVLGGLKFIKITQESYDAITNKDPNTIYIIVSAENMNNSTDLPQGN